MSQEQQDYYKSLIGDGMAKVTISRQLSEADYGNGGQVFVSVTLTCDQSESAVGQAIGLANQIAENSVLHYHAQLHDQLVQKGILKP